MNDLKVIENNGLIKIYETSKGEKVVNARELHEGMESASKFADWIKNRLEECDATENSDYTTFSKNCIEFILSKFDFSILDEQ